MFGDSKKRMKAIEAQLEVAMQSSELLSKRLKTAEEIISDLSKKCIDFEAEISALKQSNQTEEQTVPPEDTEAKRFVFEAQQFFHI